QKKVKNQYQVKTSENHSNSGGEFNNAKDSDREISILRVEKTNNIITKLMQAILEKKAAVGTPKLELFWSPTINVYTNLNNIDSDSNSEIIEDGFEVETAKGHSIIFFKKLGDTIKRLENEIKSNKHSEMEKAYFYTTTIYIKNGAFPILRQDKNMKEETRPVFNNIVILERSVHIIEFLTDIGGYLVLYEKDKAAFPNLLSEAYII
ncbi:19474_t:CDS:2, partial [Racocetra persica]